MIVVEVWRMREKKGIGEEEGEKGKKYERKMKTGDRHRNRSKWECQNTGPRVAFGPKLPLGKLNLLNQIKLNRRILHFPRWIKWED
jgi:hypothetical protein